MINRCFSYSFLHVGVGTLRSSPQPRTGCIQLTAATLEKGGAEGEVDGESADSDPGLTPVGGGDGRKA